MVNSLKHKWMYYALSILVAVVAAYESVGLLLCSLGISGLLRYRRVPVVHQVAVSAVAALMFFYVEAVLERTSEPLVLPAQFEMTDTYKMNGPVLRGFMRAEDGRAVYFMYEFRSEQEKRVFEEASLAGHTFFVQGVLEPPDEPNHRYSFAMADYLKSKGALGIVRVQQLAHVAAPDGIVARIYAWRHKLSAHMEAVFPKSLVAEAQALIIGEQDAVDPELNRAYQKLGITHLFAISGLHVALVSLLFFQGLLRLGVRRELATLILIVILPMYALLAGGAPSVWRAVSVVEFVMLARYLKWRLPIDDALALSFIVFVVLEPGAVYQVGFQLSYLATASLIYSSPLLQRAQTWWLQGFYMTLVSQLMTYPLLLKHFYELSLSSFVANIVFVPLFSFVILPINIALLALSFMMPRVTVLLFQLYEPVRGWLTDLILWLQDIPYQMWVAGEPSNVWMMVLYVSVFAGLVLLMQKEKIVQAVLVLLVPALALTVSHYVQSDVRISFMNVGQGDSVLIELPYRRAVYLIDTGGVLRFPSNEVWKERQTVYEVGRQVVVPYLKGKGIAQIDALILTHADADHVEGAEEVMKEIRVGEVHVTPGSAKEQAMQDVVAQAMKQQIRLVEKLAGEMWQVGDAQFSYIWPQDTTYEGNNDSLVLRMQYGAFKGLFTGDLEAEGEKVLVRESQADIANVSVLKAGHHGSKTSSSEEFVELTKPQLTVFMAGKDNRYGHPHAEVTERFQSRSLPYIITGEDGTIELSVTKESITVQ